MNPTTKLYFVIAPNGGLAWVGTNEAAAEAYRPAWDYDSGALLQQGYELYSVDADTPWIDEREERRMAHGDADVNAAANAVQRGIQARFER